MTFPNFDTAGPVSSFFSSPAVKLPVATALKQRNVLLDELFYDVGALSKSEMDFLVDETNLEGSILVIPPGDTSGKNRIRKFEDYERLRAAPGRLLSRFSIAGVGSSDVGAAALARNLADHYGQPVGAIVAGYGVADLLAEGLGGWFVLGGGNYLMRLFRDQNAESDVVMQQLQTSIDGFDQRNAEAVASALTGSPDSTTLLRLLLDEDRDITTVLGHSKGCLSIAWAIQALVLSGATDAIEKAKDIRVITTGAGIRLPSGFANAGQYLGALDTFGAMNSRGAGNLIELYLGDEIQWIPAAGHHVNTELPLHLSISDVLSQDDVSSAPPDPITTQNVGEDRAELDMQFG